MRNGARAIAAGGSGDARGIHLPDASADRATWAGFVPDLWHGAGAADGDRGGTGKSRAGFDDPQILGERHADNSGAGAGNVRPDSRAAAAAYFDYARHGLDGAGAGDSSGAVGRLAVLRARVGVGGE